MTSSDHLVLYVDDEWPNRVVFEQTFGAHFQIKVVSSGAAALEVLKAQEVAILLADQRMPEMSGHDLLVKVKELYPDTIRVVVTAYSDLDPLLNAVNTGLVHRYIIKPWDRGEFEQLLKWGIEAYLLGRESSALQLRIIETERLVTLGTIGATIFHEMSQPLSHLAMSAQRIAMLTQSVEAHSALRELGSELPEIAGEMIDSCTLINNLIGGLRQFMRHEQSPDSQSIDPILTIRYALSVCREIADRAGSKLEYVGPDALPALRIGATALSQVLINLLANASQALLDSGKRAGQVNLHAAVLDSKVEFVVSDDGPGIAPDLLSKVGSPFFTTRATGTGLGVSMCRRLVERSGGALRIESTLAVGTKVTFVVPLA